ncbi:uncharacterized protein LOC117178481 [Belonocnema kinseyi]|uniref:uncharacterized protein LOC117178481 n=1 Tax=Belonocnema kinseyi TaxID=2817044 RepID=UPI00143DB302|nr:uncharacterized protein LOC117178481 [Belonocnema kinseyi]
MIIVICALLFTSIIFFINPVESTVRVPRGYNVFQSEHGMFIVPEHAMGKMINHVAYMSEGGKPYEKVPPWDGTPRNHPKLEDFQKNDLMLNERNQIVGIVLEDKGVIHETIQPGSMEVKRDSIAKPQDNYIIKRGNDFFAKYYNGWAPYHLAHDDFFF